MRTDKLGQGEIVTINIPQWERTSTGQWYVVEHGGMLKTGAFNSQDEAVEWFRRELDIELDVKDMDRRLNEAMKMAEKAIAKARG